MNCTKKRRRKRGKDLIIQGCKIEKKDDLRINGFWGQNLKNNIYILSFRQIYWLDKCFSGPESDTDELSEEEDDGSDDTSSETSKVKSVQD